MKGDPGYQAFRILQAAFVVIPILMGFDKFFYSMTNWDSYLSPMAMQFIGQHHRAFFGVVGVVEIVAGLGVLLRPRIFSYIVFVWLLCIVINLLMKGHYLDVVLRDVGLMFGALSLARLSKKYATK